MEYDPKKILVLYADAGFGHKSAATAIKAALEERYEGRCQVEMVNPLDDKRAPFFLRDSQSDYDRIVLKVPELYKFGYEASDAEVPGALAESGLGFLLYDVMEDLVKRFQPDAIVTTYPVYQSPLNYVFTLTRKRIPLITTVTDLVTVHRLWFYRGVDLCLVPTPQVGDLARSYGIPTDAVKVTGIPVHPNVVRETRPAREIRAELGWDPDLTTILAVGSRRVANLMDSLNVLNHFGAPLQLAVIAGKDDDLYQALQAVEWHQKTHLYEFVDNMPVMMHAADGIMCKAGGLIVTESLACGLPMMLVDVLPGQEEGNANYVVQGGAANQTLNPLDVMETISHWTMDGGKLMRERAENARRLGKPNSAYETADLVYDLAVNGTTRKPNRLTHRLREFLKTYPHHFEEKDAE